MGEMVERLARVICDYYEDLPDVATYMQRKLATRDFIDKQDVRTTASAAIAAMSEPTDGMLVAVLKITRDPENGHVADWTAGLVYRSMIREAMK